MVLSKKGMSFSKTEQEKRLVPWFSMSEWFQVYKQIFSDDTKDQIKGYEMLVVWKARCPTLPAGAECTLHLIQVCLQDRQMWHQMSEGDIPLYHEHDLRLMYATALTRFLNHITHLGQVMPFPLTLYEVAEKLHVPEWLVNLRHEASHGHSLPPLGVLRTAAHFALDWLHDNYWKSEAEKTVNWVISEGEVPQAQVIARLRDLLEKYHAIKLYSIAGYDFVRKLPDQEFINYLQILKVKKEARKSKKKKRMEKERKKRKTSGEAEGVHEEGPPHAVSSKDKEGAIMQKMPSFRVKEAVSLVWKQILCFMKREVALRKKEEILVGALIEGEVLIPKPDMLKRMLGQTEAENSNVGLPPTLARLWNEMLVVVHQLRTLPLLLEKLIMITSDEAESPYRRRMASLWIVEIAKGMIKVQRAMKLRRLWERQGRCKKRKTKMKSDFVFTGTPPNKKAKKAGVASNNANAKVSVKRMLLEQVENNDPSLKDGLSFSLMNLVFVRHTLHLVRVAFLKPAEFTPKFLPYLLDLMDPPMPDNLKTNIMNIVSIYSRPTPVTDHRNSSFLAEGAVPSEPLTPQQIFTVETLKDKLAEKKNLQLVGELLKLSNAAVRQEKDAALTSDKSDLESNAVVSTMHGTNQNADDEDKSNKKGGDVDWDTERDSEREIVLEPAAQEPLKDVPCHWVRCEDGEDWSKCPFGVLPWQRGQDTLSLELPDVHWKPVDPLTWMDSFVPGLFKGKVNWDEVMRRRPRKRSYPDKDAQTKLIVKAFKAAFNVT